MTFQLRGFAAAPLAGQIAMGTRCHQRTTLKLRACPSAAPELTRPCHVSFSAEVAAAFTDAFFCAAALLDFRISSQQFDAHIS